MFRIMSRYETLNTETLKIRYLVLSTFKKGLQGSSISAFKCKPNVAPPLKFCLERNFSVCTEFYDSVLKKLSIWKLVFYWQDACKKCKT